MKHLSDYITEQMVTEKYVTMIKGEQTFNLLDEWGDEIMKILKDTYKDIGGSGVTDLDGLKEETDIVKMVKRGNHVSAVNLYTTKRGGRKAIAGGCDGTEQGKKDFEKIFDEDFTQKDRNTFIEISGRPLGKVLKNDNLTIVPDYIAASIMSDKEIEPMGDGYFYKRMIHGTPHIKIMIGNPVGQVSYPTTPEQRAHLKELSFKYASME